MKSNPQPPAPQAGWHVAQFCRAVGISRTNFYTMTPKALRPHSVALGRRRIVIESPADWLRRVKTTQEGCIDGIVRSNTIKESC